VRIRRPARWLLASAGVPAFGLVAALLRPAPAAPPPRPAGDAGFAEWRGVASCTSSACHNQDAGRSAYARGSEYAVWAGRDPHARAYQVLFDKRSLGIQDRLNGADPSKNPVRPDQNLLCIRCHVDPGADKAVEAAPVWFGDGVGCESCHGRAGNWLTLHYGREWGGLTAGQKERLGFHDMKDLAGQASVCTACHVGGDRAEVNHDLIAAGHPALLFEFSSFLDRYRPYQHWSEAEDRRSHPALEAEAWTVGQAVSAEAALRLLAIRARGDGPWPEFAEYDCASCHHDLQPRARDAPRGHKAGVPAWSWYTAMTPLLPSHDGDDALLWQLRDEMEAPHPERDVVAGKAEALAAAYHEWLNRRAGRIALRGGLMMMTGDKGEQIAGGGWEDARQLSFGISAYQRSLERVEPGPDDARTAALVDRLAGELRPPLGQDTPRTFDATKATDCLRQIHARLAGR